MSVPFYGSVNAVLRDNTTHKLTLLKKLLSSRRSKLIVVSDFDHTLTKFTSAQCHDIVGYNKQYSREFIKEFKEIFYKPMASLSEWWRVAHDLLVNKSGLTKDMLKDRLNEEVIAVRDGLPDFAVNLRLKYVPLIIVSAGIKDVIAHAMASCNISIAGDHLFHIDANFLDFHESGQLANIYPEEPVHSQSKQLVHQRAAHMFSFMTKEANQLESDLTVGSVDVTPAVEDAGLLVMEELQQTIGSDTKSPNSIGSSTFLDSPQKKSALEVTTSTIREPSVDTVVAVVMGDRPHDFFVMDAFPEVHTFRIGFARHNRSEDVQGLLQEGECDVVLVGEEHSLEAVHLLVEELIQRRCSEWDRRRCRCSPGHCIRYKYRNEIVNKAAVDFELVYVGSVNTIACKTEVLVSLPPPMLITFHIADIAFHFLFALLPASSGPRPALPLTTGRTVPFSCAVGLRPRAPSAAAARGRSAQNNEATVIKYRQQEGLNFLAETLTSSLARCSWTLASLKAISLRRLSS